MKKLLFGFGYAFRGIYYCFSERNFRIDVVAIILVSWFSVLYSLESEKTLFLILIFALVLFAEAINTAIERLCDKISPQRCEEIKKAKDVSAGAVLITAISSVFSLPFLFGNVEKLTAAIVEFSNPVRLFMFIIFITAAIIFIFLPERKKK